MTRAVIIIVGTKPRRVFPGRKESLGGARPKKYLKFPDLVMRNATSPVKRAARIMVNGRLLR